MVQNSIIAKGDNSPQLETKKIPMSMEEKSNETFGKFPNKLRDAIVSDGSLSILSKLVFILIAYEKKTKGESFTPNFNHMVKNYGVSKPNYSEALKQLSDLGFIKKEVVEYRNNGRLSITIPDSVLNKSWAYIPSSILCTDIYDNNQKMMIIFLISMFFNVKNQSYGIRSATAADIYNRCKEIGFQKRFTFKALKELSDPTCGYIPILTKSGSGYSMNFSVLSIIGDRVIDRLKSGIDFTYKKPKPHDFFFLESEMRIVQDPKSIPGTSEFFESMFGQSQTFEEAKAQYEKEYGEKLEYEKIIDKLNN